MLEEEYNPPRKLPPHLRPAPPAEPAFSFELRQATERDVPDMLEIYNHYVANSTVTFDEDPLTLKEMRVKYRDVERLGFPWLVAVSPTGMILGYAYVTPWKAKAAYRYTVEDSIYLSPAATGKGLGKALMARMLDDAKAAGIKEVIAVIADKGAEASIATHEKFGFKKTGELGKVGFKFNRWLGTIMMQKSLKGGPKAARSAGRSAKPSAE
jgi:phosphinothricin acetyltransferase